MKSGFKILWTDHALNELEQTIYYLEKEFMEKEIRKLVNKIESITELISRNPNIFPKSENKQIFKAIVLKYNTMFYRINKENIEILSFFSNRQNPKKRKV